MPTMLVVPTEISRSGAVEVAVVDVVIAAVIAEHCRF